MRRINEDGLELIKRFEGFSATVYKDVAGKATIGYGHLLKPGEKMESLTKSEGEALLICDVAKAEQAVERLIHVPLSENEFSALVSFAFNLGSGALQRSTLRRKINDAELIDIETEWRRWVWAGGRRYGGLLRRREAELALFFSP